MPLRSDKPPPGNVTNRANPQAHTAAILSKQAEESLRRLNLELESRVEERTAELKSMNQALQKSHRRLQVLSHRLVQVQEDERRSLARELYDQVGQSLIALNLNLTIIHAELSKGYTEHLGTRMADERIRLDAYHHVNPVRIKSGRGDALVRF